MPELERHYKNFCNDLVDIFDKDWNKVEDKVVTSYQFLEHIPRYAWKPMVGLAVETWDGWPRNWVKAVNEIYSLFRKSEPVVRKVEACAECNGAGIFSAYKRVEVKPGVFMKYSFASRCAACRNWVGQYGTAIPEMLPLVAHEHGYDGVETYSSPITEKTEYFSLHDILSQVGKQVNPATPRPAVQRIPDDVPF